MPRYVSDAELAACFRRAAIVVAPYREIEQSGVVATALAFGAPLVVSDVGGFGELGAAGAARVVPPADAGALREALAGLLADPAERERLAAAARGRSRRGSGRGGAWRSARGRSTRRWSS